MNKFLRIAAIFLVSLFLGKEIHAQQDVELVNSADVLSEGFDMYYYGKYNKAANLFKKVSRNDTNYALATLFLCYAYNEDKEDSLCLLAAKKGLALESSHHADFYTFGVISLREMKKYDDALLMADEAIKMYPLVYALHYNKGVVYYEQKKFKEAELCFQEAIRLNYYHALSHYYLGKCELDQGRTVPALLSFETYLIMSNNEDRTDKVVVTVEDIYKNNYDFDPDTKLEKDQMGDECFDDLLEIITSGIAMKPTYKNKTGINFNFVKVRQAMFESMTYKENTGNWWMENYIPFYLEMQKQGHFIAFNYWSLRTISDVSIQKGFKKHKKKIRAFAKWLNEYTREFSKHPEKMALKEQKDADIIFWDNSMVAGVGHRNPTTDKMYGEWTYFYANSGLLLGRGSYSNTGLEEGDWIYYHPNGQMKEKTHYTAGKQDGLSEYWWDNGEKRGEYHYVKGVMTGSFEERSYHGGLQTTGSYLNGKLNGPCTVYNDNDGPEYEVNYVNGKLNGDFKSYYQNGKLANEIKVTNDKKNGPAKEYYVTGELMSEGAYKTDKSFGPWKVYYKNGNVLREGTYKSPGKREGVWKEYYENGKVATEAMFKAGELNGPRKEYAETGELINENIFKAGKITKSTYYNLKGKVLGEYNITKGRTEVKEFYENGMVAAEGDYLNGMRDGQWTIYHSNGGWKMAHINYERDEYDGRMKYYHPNGKVMYETSYEMGIEDGYRKTFYINGEIESEGWVKDEMKQGDWFEYNQRAIQVEHTYYLNDEQYGVQEFFDARGRMREEVVLKYNTGVERRLYDSTGAIEFTYKAKNGTGDFQPPYKNGKLWHEGKFRRGLRDGQYKRYAWDGRVVWEGEYVMGRVNGLRKSYYDWDNQLYNECTYRFGVLDGKYNAWWENGQKRWEENYVDDELEGEQRYYHTNGQLSSVANRHEGEFEGEVKYYSPDGMLSHIRYYKHGDLLGYAYEGTDGNIIPMKELDEATGKIECYFRNGKKSVEGEFANGEMHGHWIEYYSDGSVKEDENWEYGERNGIQTRYYPDGKLQEVETFYMGAVDGPSKYYYPNGNLKRFETWTLDNEWSRWYFYNENGQLTTTRLFYAGIQQDEVVVPVAPPTPDPKPKKPKGK